MAPRRKRVIQSYSPSPEPGPSSVAEDDDAEREEEAMDVDEIEDDAEGEEEEEEEVEEDELEEEVEEDEEEVEGDEGNEASQPSSHQSDELEEDAADEYMDEEPEILPKATTSRTAKKASASPAQPSSALKIKFSVKGKGRPLGPGSGAGEKRPSRAAARKSSKRTKLVAKDADLGSDEDDFGDFDEDEIDQLDSRAGSSRRSLSPTKMTARQRAKGNKDLQDTLLKLPQSNEGSSKKLILTEAERIQRREEVARRRKRQTEQKLQDEQDQTINRLLRAQTGRSRAKLDVPSPGDDTPGTGSRYASPSRRASGAPKSDMIRWVSSIQDDKVVIRVGAPAGKEEWIKLASLDDAPSEAKPQHRNTRGTCGVRGCSQSRKYRSVKRFEVGGCCMEHLKKVEASLA